MSDEYGEATQRLLLSYMISDPASYSLCQNILSPDYFDSKLQGAVKYVLDYTEQYKALPTPSQIYAGANVLIERFDEVNDHHGEWFLEQIEGFCRHSALELAVLEGAEKLSKGEQAGAELEKKIREAMTISLMRDLGTSYFDDPFERLQRMRDRSQYYTTGWKTLDQKLGGGFSKGALNVFAGGSGSGKSLFLQNLALNWTFMGLDVIYFTLELSEDLTANRLDAMVSGMRAADIFKSDSAIREVATAVRMKGMGKVGNLLIKKMPEAGTCANDLRAYLKEYEIQNGKKPDAVLIDYLDLMHPNNRKVDPSDLFVKDKYTSEEMRALAAELGCLLATASQLNRSSINAQDFDHSHIAGGISKINTADNVFAIRTNSQMRDAGKYALHFLKTRSSSVVGQEIELAYDQTSLVISDFASEYDNQKPKSAAELQAELRAKVSSNTGDQSQGSLGGRTISQLAHPQGKSREQIMAEKGQTPEEAPASGARTTITDLMANLKKPN